MIAKPRKILLVRHGESELNAQKRISGQLDAGLSQKGRQQARLLAKACENEPLTAIYTSTLKRAIETATPAAQSHGLVIQRIAALRELHLGALQGCYKDERDPQARRLWLQRKADKLAFAPPGGETFADLEKRVLPAWQQLLETVAGGVVLVVGHRSVNRILLGSLMGWPREKYVRLNLRHKFLYRITCGAQHKLETILLTDEEFGRCYSGLKV